MLWNVNIIRADEKEHYIIFEINVEQGTNFYSQLERKLTLYPTQIVQLYETKFVFLRNTYFSIIPSNLGELNIMSRDEIRLNSPMCLHFSESHSFKSDKLYSFEWEIYKLLDEWLKEEFVNFLCSKSLS